MGVYDVSYELFDELQKVEFNSYHSDTLILEASATNEKRNRGTNEQIFLTFPRRTYED